jgi:small subunit ribosomal protein S16
MFRIVVQESRVTPTSGKVVAQIGSFDPHSKTTTLDGDKASFYLKNGAQPSGRAALILQKQGVELPKWVRLSEAKTGGIRNPDKLRRNQPKEEAAPEAEAPADAPEAETGTTES